MRVPTHPPTHPPPYPPPPWAFKYALPLPTDPPTPPIHPPTRLLCTPPPLLLLKPRQQRLLRAVGEATLVPHHAPERLLHIKRGDTLAQGGGESEGGAAPAGPAVAACAHSSAPRRTRGGASSKRPPLTSWMHSEARLSGKLGIMGGGRPCRRGCHRAAGVRPPATSLTARPSRPARSSARTWWPLGPGWMLCGAGGREGRGGGGD